MTDLCVDKNGEVEHARFDPAGPGSTKWLHHRLMKIHGKIEDPGEWIPESLSGRGRRVNDNGLGFDLTRIGSRADESDNLTDPVIEVLAFFGLAFLTVRGPAVDARLKSSADTGVRQRGWRKDGGQRFHWPAWRQPLDRDAMDALLDLWDPGKRKTWSPYGIHAAWRSVRFEPDSKSNPTRAFGAERLS